MSIEVRLPNGCGLKLARKTDTLETGKRTEVKQILNCTVQDCPLRKALQELNPIVGRATGYNRAENAKNEVNSRIQRLVTKKCSVLQVKTNSDNAFDVLRDHLGYDVGATRIPNPPTAQLPQGPRIRVVQGGAPGLGKGGSRGSGKKN